MTGSSIDAQSCYTSPPCWAQANLDLSPDSRNFTPRLLEPWARSYRRGRAGSRRSKDSAARLRDRECGGRCTLYDRIDSLPVAVRAASNLAAHGGGCCKCHSEVQDATTVMVSVAEILRAGAQCRNWIL